MAELNPRLRGLLTEYAAATKNQEVAQRQVDELGAKRARILAQLHTAGLSYRKIAGLLTVAQMPMSASRVQKMVERARATNTNN